MEDHFRIISDIIKNRRTVKPAKMNGKIIPDEQVMQLLRLADWAPNHKKTEPWRFIVYAGEKAPEFASQHAELYKAKAEKFDQTKYDKILAYGSNVSHIIVVVMKRSENIDLPKIEEICATAAAIENILIGATAAGIASFWSTGGMTQKKAMKDFLGLKEEDVIIGILYLGYSDIAHTGKRIIPLEEKITWNK